MTKEFRHFLLVKIEVTVGSVHLKRQHFSPKVPILNNYLQWMSRCVHTELITQKNAHFKVRV
jgi:hypothetical protein